MHGPRCDTPGLSDGPPPTFHAYRLGRRTRRFLWRYTIRQARTTRGKSGRAWATRGARASRSGMRGVSSFRQTSCVEAGEADDLLQKSVDAAASSASFRRRRPGPRKPRGHLCHLQDILPRGAWPRAAALDPNSSVLATIRGQPDRECSHAAAIVVRCGYATRRFTRDFRADDGTRTHDLLHGKYNEDVPVDQP